MILFIFTLLNTKMYTMIVSNPSLSDYIHLQDLYKNVLTCPCLNVTIPYGRFISLTPTFHKVCSSDYVSEEWISMLLYIKTSSSLNEILSI